MCLFLFVSFVLLGVRMGVFELCCVYAGFPVRLGCGCWGVSVVLLCARYGCWCVLGVFEAVGASAGELNPQVLLRLNSQSGERLGQDLVRVKLEGKWRAVV